MNDNGNDNDNDSSGERLQLVSLLLICGVKGGVEDGSG